jgi:hypothetical protein
LGGIGFALPMWTVAVRRRGALLDLEGLDAPCAAAIATDRKGKVMLKMRFFIVFSSTVRLVSRVD